MQTVEKLDGKETSNLRQSAGMLQADEKQLENDVSGRVSESRKCFQLGTQFRDTSREHSTSVHDKQSTHIEHHHREKQEQEAVTNDEQDRLAVQAQSIDKRFYKKVENFTGEHAWRDWSFQFKATNRIVNEAAYHLIETAENEEKEINDALSLSEEQRSLSFGIFNILGTLVKGEPLQILHTSGSSGFEAWRKLSKKYNERNVEKQQETRMKEMKIRFGRYHGRDCETIYQEDRNYCQWVLNVDTGNPAVIELTSSKHATNNGKNNAENKRELNWRKGKQK